MDLVNSAIAHWPFLAAALIFAMAGQVVKATFFTKANIRKYKKDGPAWLGEMLWWGRKTLPMHPVGLGVVMGLVPGMPVGPGIETAAATVLYFAFAGLCSTWAFSVIKQLAKKKGIDLDLPGDTSTTPPPPAGG